MSVSPVVRLMQGQASNWQSLLVTGVEHNPRFQRDADEFYMNLLSKIPSLEKIRNTVQPPELVHRVELVFQEIITARQEASNEEITESARLTTRQYLSNKVIGQLNSFLPRYAQMIVPIIRAQYAIQYEQLREKMGENPNAGNLPSKPVSQSSPDDTLKRLYATLREISENTQFDHYTIAYLELLSSAQAVYGKLVNLNGVRSLTPATAEMMVFMTRECLEELLMPMNQGPVMGYYRPHSRGDDSMATTPTGTPIMTPATGPSEADTDVTFDFGDEDDFGMGRRTAEPSSETVPF